MDGWTTIVMAGGKGKRMLSSQPKVLQRVAGVAIISHTAKAARQIDQASLICVVSPDNRPAISDELGDDIEYAEQPEPLGTGHALSIALKRVPSQTQNILLLNGDMPLITGDDLVALADLHIGRSAAVTVAFVTLPALEAQDLGSLTRGARGKPIGITEAVERKIGSVKDVDVAIGAYAFDAAWVRRAVDRLKPHGSGEYYVTDLVPLAVTDGQRVESIETPSVRLAIGVNTRSQLAKAERAMQQRLRERVMDGGVTLLDPDTVYLDATVECAPDATIHPNTSLKGTTVIGAGASIGPNAVLTDAIIGANAVVESAVVKSSRVSDGAHVGPFSLLRNGVFLDEGAYVGAHAEIKASTIGRGTHVGHFSYVGDAIVGDNANIGAGTVTCNFDGVSKHITRIGDRAFIGSGSMLVAPITIGDGALTGAGAVVNHDVGPGERVAGVPARLLATRASGPVAGKEGG